MEKDLGKELPLQGHCCRSSGDRVSRQLYPVSQDVAPDGSRAGVSERKAGCHSIPAILPLFFRYLQDMRSTASITHFCFQGAADS